MIATQFASKAMSADAQLAQENTGGFKIRSAPVLLNAGSNEVTILIAVSAHATGWVQFGVTEALAQRCDGTILGMQPFHDRFLRFHVTNLKPGTTYYYRVHVCPVVFNDAYRIKRGTPIATNVFSFRTLDPAAPTASFTCWNDTHEARPTVSALADLLQKSPTDFLVWNGDVTNDIQEGNRLNDQFLNPCEKPFASSVPLFFGRGNHDVRGRDARLLDEMMSGPGGAYHYGFRHGPLACIVMDTGEDKPDSHPAYAGLVNFEDYRTKQAQWLAQTIREPWFKEAAFRVAFLHIPLVWESEIPTFWAQVWGEGVKGWVCEDGYNKWHSLLVEGKVDAVISGHIHWHNAFPAREGRPYAQLIGGGPQADKAIAITGKVDSQKMDIEFRNLQNKVVDSFRFKKRT